MVLDAGDVGQLVMKDMSAGDRLRCASQKDLRNVVRTADATASYNGDFYPVVNGRKQLEVHASRGSLLIDRSDENFSRSEPFPFSDPIQHIDVSALASVVGKRLPTSAAPTTFGPTSAVWRLPRREIRGFAGVSLGAAGLWC